MNGKRFANGLLNCKYQKPRPGQAEVALRETKDYLDTIMENSLGRIVTSDITGKEPGTGEWVSVEKFIWKKARLEISSTCCPACAQKLQEKIDRDLPV